MGEESIGGRRDGTDGTESQESAWVVRKGRG
jgi:hypothetical protein